MKKILIVDDEVQILKALQRMFLETDYEILTSQNSTEALTVFESNDIDMIISDMRMPVIDGYKLLSIVKEKYPRVIRIILSGYADERPMFQALLHNVAQLYMFKPWNNDDFIQNIQKLFADDNLLKSAELINKINELKFNCKASEQYPELFSLIEEENLDELIARIEQDSEISDLLLEVSKSAVYGVMPGKVKQTAIYIGLHNMKSFLRYSCVMHSLKGDSHPKEMTPLFSHSYLTNKIFLFLYEAFLHKQAPESTMFAGLMHNIGLIILAKELSQKDSAAFSSMNLNDFYKLDVKEQELFHQDAGSYFLNQWDLPFPIYEAALYHHRPLSSNIINRELVSCVHIAQSYAWKALGVSEPEAVEPEVFASLKISPEDFEKRLKRYLKLD